MVLKISIQIWRSEVLWNPVQQKFLFGSTDMMFQELRQGKGSSKWADDGLASAA